MRNKRKKVTRQRAHTTHGYGSMKKNRGYGNRGGKGNAGSGKRGDAKKPRYWARKKYFGKFGFKPVQQKTIIACNIQQLEEQHQKLLKQGLIKEEKGVYAIDLSALGVNKLLSKGTPTKKWAITVAAASSAAMEKIKQKEGSVTVKGVAAPQPAAQEPKAE